MTRYEVFRPSTGTNVYVTRFALLARIVKRLLHSHYEGGLDWAPAGWGWVDGVPMLSESDRA